MLSNINFKIISKRKNARVGELVTPHGVVKTPAFVPVGTQATVKSLTPQDLSEIGVQILFGNTYHLHLRPGEDIVEKFGGLGEFMSWPGVTMTDSGGFQVFSLARSLSLPRGQESTAVAGNFTDRLDPHIRQDDKKSGHDAGANLVKVSEDGVLFRSHLDGSSHMFTPEQSIGIQKKLGADIILAFDQCTTYPVTHESTREDMDRTHRWAIRSLGAFRKPGKFPQALYGIVQGGVFEDLRTESAKFIGKESFDGFAIGGVSVGESKIEMQNVVTWTIPHLPDEKVRHLLGVGDVDDIFEIIERGIDTFDCVTPSRLGRVGCVFVHPPEGNLTNRFRLDITKSMFALDQGPLVQNCTCYVCQTFTRGYIHHLFRARELLAYRLATYHNIFFIINLTGQIRKALLEDRFDEMKREWML